MLKNLLTSLKRPFSFFILSFIVSSIALTLPAYAKKKAPETESAPAVISEVAIPLKAPLFAVIKGIFPTQAKAQSTQTFIQQLMGKTPADGIVESAKLQGFPKGKWVILSVFDSEVKAKWWMNFSDRNKKLPRPYIKPTQLLAEADLPYFPEAIRDGAQRFHTEAEVVEKVKSIPDVKKLQEKFELQFLFTVYPRRGDYAYEVEILQKNEAGKFIAYDFIAMDAFDLNHFSRYLDQLKKG